MDKNSDLYIKTLERKLQQQYNPPWAVPAVFHDQQKLVKQLCDRAMKELSSFSLEQTKENLQKLVTTCEQLKALGYHPTIIGERKIPSGVFIIREDIWLKIQRLKEEQQNNADTSCPPA